MIKNLYRRLRSLAGRIRRKLHNRYDGELFIFAAGEVPPVTAASLLPPGYAVSELSAERLAARPDWFDGEPHSRRRFEHYLAGKHRIFVATDAAGRLCGWGMIDAVTPLRNPGAIDIFPNGAALLHTLFVRPECRGRRLGRALDLAQLQTLKPGQPGLCFVRRRNRPALRNWAGLGFTPVALVRARAWFGRPWRHTFIPYTGDCAEIPPAPPVHLRLNGPAAAWELRGIRIVRLPPLPAATGGKP